MSSPYLLKAKAYCTYQERCHREVREKLYSLSLHKKEVDEIISTLIEENYLNEERFAIQFAGGRFRIKQWGRVRIKYALKQKQVSQYCIRKAIDAIDEKDYLATLRKLSSAKSKTLKNEKNSLIRKRKLQDHLIQKGYERDLVIRITDED